jgi:hypothetical protein
MTKTKRRCKSDDSGGADPDVPVGPGNPPRKHRFAAGKSGNPSGRPPKSRNLKTVWSEHLAKKVSAREGERKRRVPMVDALVLKTLARALDGSERANDKALDAAERYVDDGRKVTADETAREDQEIMRVLEERLRTKIQNKKLRK